MKKTKNSTNKNEKETKEIEKENKVIIHISDRDDDYEPNYDNAADYEGFIFDDEDY